MNEMNNKAKISSLLDSGCTDHVVNSDKYFDRCEDFSNPIKVKLADGKELKATKVGNIKASFKVYDKENLVNIQNVHYVNGIKQNLLSVSKITENNYTIVDKRMVVRVYDDKRELLAIADKNDSLYESRSVVSTKESNNGTNEVFANVTSMSQKEKWRRALGHVNFQ